MRKKVVSHKKVTKAGKNKRWRNRFSSETLIIMGTILGGVAIFAAFIISSQGGDTSGYDPNIPDESIGLDILTSPHIEPDEEATNYNSNPPTSGAHYVQPAPWGVYAETLPDQTLIHNLEHGGIWISYRDKSDKDTVKALEDLAEKYDSHLIVTYRPENDSSIVVAAWGRLLKLDEVDKGQIVNFIARYRFKGPESA